MTSKHIALSLGALALALILGALGFQYLAGFAPCRHDLAGRLHSTHGLPFIRTQALEETQK